MPAPASATFAQLMVFARASAGPPLASSGGMAWRPALLLVLLSGCDFSSTATTPIEPPVQQASPQQVQADKQRASKEAFQRTEGIWRKTMRAESALSVLRVDPAERSEKQV